MRLGEGNCWTGVGLAYWMELILSLWSWEKPNFWIQMVVCGSLLEFFSGGLI